VHSTKALVHSTLACSSYAACASGARTGRTSWHKDRSRKVPEHSRLALEHSTKACSSYAACASASRTGCTCDRKDHSRMALEHSRSAREHNRKVQVHSHNRANGSRTYRLGRWRQRRRSYRQPTTQGKQNGHSSRGLQLDFLPPEKNNSYGTAIPAPGKQNPVLATVHVSNFPWLGTINRYRHPKTKPSSKMPKLCSRIKLSVQVVTDGMAVLSLEPHDPAK